VSDLRLLLVKLVKETKLPCYRDGGTFSNLEGTKKIQSGHNPIKYENHVSGRVDWSGCVRSEAAPRKVGKRDKVTLLQGWWNIFKSSGGNKMQSGHNQMNYKNHVFGRVEWYHGTWPEQPPPPSRPLYPT
jgi:hypothetical protein